MARSGGGRAVRRVRGDEEEERPAAFGGPPDRRHGMPGDHVGQVVLGPAAVADVPAVLVQDVLVVVVAGGEPLVPARRYVGLLVRLVLVHVLADQAGAVAGVVQPRSEEHTSELQSLLRTSYAVFCLKK